MYHNSLAIAIFSIILLPLKKICFHCLSHILISCWTLDIQEEKVAIINLHFVWFNNIFSSDSQISFSDLENHFLIDQVESDISKVIHLLPISQILDKSAGLSIAGVKSILKSQVCTIRAPPGVSKSIQTQSGIEWLTLKNSAVKWLPIFTFSVLSHDTSTNVV